VNLFYIKGDNMIQAVANRNINTGDIENCGLELEAQYRINRHWTVNTNHSLLHMATPVAAAPKYKGFLETTFHDGKWEVIASLQYFSGIGLDRDNDGKVDCTQKDFCLVGCTVNYAILKNLSLWLRGENLLAQRYEINYGFPMPKATFMSGVNISL
jgi:iron complex outermembrane receptor protein